MRPLPEPPDQRVASPYHELSSIFHLIDLADEITCRPAQSFGLSCTGQGLERLPLEKNLAWKAAQAFATTTGLKLPALHIHIEKHIPSGAGLAGGSTDAAAVLLLLARACGADRGDGMNCQLQQIAPELGADVAFFLAASAACLMGGRGDTLLTSLPPAAGVPVAIAWDPSAPVSTPRVYQAFEQHQQPIDAAGEAALGAALECADIEQLARHLYNNLSAAAFAVSPAAFTVYKFLEGAPQSLATALSGSGGASFAFCASEVDRDGLVADALATGFAAQAVKLTGQTLSAQLTGNQEVGKK